MNISCFQTISVIDSDFGVIFASRSLTVGVLTQRPYASPNRRRAFLLELELSQQFFFRCIPAVGQPQCGSRAATSQMQLRIEFEQLRPISRIYQFSHRLMPCKRCRYQALGDETPMCLRSNARVAFLAALSSSIFGSHQISPSIAALEPGAVGPGFDHLIKGAPSPVSPDIRQLTKGPTRERSLTNCAHNMLVRGPPGTRQRIPKKSMMGVAATDPIRDLAARLADRQLSGSRNDGLNDRNGARCGSSACDPNSDVQLLVLFA